MGGDRAPGAIIEGAVQACRDGDGPIILVGDEARVAEELSRLDTAGLDLDVRHAPRSPSHILASLLGPHRLVHGETA